MTSFMITFRKKLYREIPDTRLLQPISNANLEHFEAEPYVIAKVENRYGDTVNINIKAGHRH